MSGTAEVGSMAQHYAWATWWVGLQSPKEKGSFALVLLGRQRLYLLYSQAVLSSNEHTWKWVPKAEVHHVICISYTILSKSDLTMLLNYSSCTKCWQLTKALLIWTDVYAFFLLKEVCSALLYNVQACLRKKETKYKMALKSTYCNPTYKPTAKNYYGTFHMFPTLIRWQKRKIKA